MANALDADSFGINLLSGALQAGGSYLQQSNGTATLVPSSQTTQTQAGVTVPGTTPAPGSGISSTPWLKYAVIAVAAVVILGGIVYVARR